MVSSTTMKVFFFVFCFVFNTTTMIMLFEIKSTAVFNIYIYIYIFFFLITCIYKNVSMAFYICSSLVTSASNEMVEMQKW